MTVSMMRPGGQADTSSSLVRGDKPVEGGTQGAQPAPAGDSRGTVADERAIADPIGAALRHQVTVDTSSAGATLETMKRAMFYRDVDAFQAIQSPTGEVTSRVRGERALAEKLLNGYGDEARVDMAFTQFVEAPPDRSLLDRVQRKHAPTDVVGYYMVGPDGANPIKTILRQEGGQWLISDQKELGRWEFAKLVTAVRQNGLVERLQQGAAMAAIMPGFAEGLLERDEGLICTFPIFSGSQQPKTEAPLALHLGDQSVVVHNPSPTTTNILTARQSFVTTYCQEKGWDINNLEMSQLLEIRSQPGWKNPQGGSEA